MEIIVFKIGAAVSKAILKLWLKDSAIAKAVGLGLADVLEKKVSDIRAQRRAKRQFEAIGDRIAESLLPLFEHANLEENDKEAVGLAVAGTLDDAQITPALLARLAGRHGPLRPLVLGLLSGGPVAAGGDP